MRSNYKTIKIEHILSQKQWFRKLLERAIHTSSIRRIELGKTANRNSKLTYFSSLCNGHGTRTCPFYPCQQRAANRAPSPRKAARGESRELFRPWSTTVVQLKVPY